MTARRSLSSAKRLALFLAHDGRCHLCSGKIKPGERWEVEHPIPIALGGANDETNMAPAHVKCHAGKSATDAGDIARAKRREIRHIGARMTRRPMDGSRASKWKRKMDGTVEARR